MIPLAPYLESRFILTSSTVNKKKIHFLQRQMNVVVLKLFFGAASFCPKVQSHEATRHSKYSDSAVI